MNKEFPGQRTSLFFEVRRLYLLKKNSRETNGHLGYLYIYIYTSSPKKVLENISSHSEKIIWRPKDFQEHSDVWSRSVLLTFIRLFAHVHLYWNFWCLLIIFLKQHRQRGPLLTFFSLSSLLRLSFFSSLFPLLLWISVVFHSSVLFCLLSLSLSLSLCLHFFPLDAESSLTASLSPSIHLSPL